MQSRRWSAIEAVCDAASGFGIAVLLNHLLLPFWGFQPTYGESMEIGSVFFIAAVARRYVFRRIFNR
jgi:hypothetical protein